MKVSVPFDSEASSLPRGSAVRDTFSTEASPTAFAADGSLDTNSRCCQDTAQYLGIDYMVRRHKMRKCQIFGEEPETYESE